MDATGRNSGGNSSSGSKEKQDDKLVPGQEWDSLVASALRKVPSRPSPARPSVRLLKEPKVVHHPQTARNLAAIPDHVRRAIRGCLTGETNWPLFLHGPAGTGKTCAALCLLDHVGGEYFTVGDLCEKLNQSAMGRLEWSREGRGGTLWPDRFRLIYLSQPVLLVLDELGLRDTVSDAHYESVYRAVELRMGRPFVVISNHPLERLEKIYDARTVSRLGAGTLVEVSGADRRLQ